MTGFIILDKPENLTSFKASAVVRHIIGEKKAGHSGTLDPMATGVMTIAVGHATRFIDLLPCHDKAYEASFRLGETTDTLDITGKVLTKSDDIPSPEKVLSSYDNFRGNISQLPPMYSAISVNGQRLYDLARQGIEVERERRNVTIYALENLGYSDNEYKILVKCSKGTYIRSLISDIGENLGCGAVMTSLRRTEANGFTLNDSHTLEEMRELAENKAVNDIILSVDSAFTSYDEIIVSDAQSRRFSNGGELDIKRLTKKITPSVYRVYSPTHKFLGLGEYTENSESLTVKRVFVND